MRPFIVLLASSIAVATAYPSYLGSLHARNADVIGQRDVGLDNGFRHSIIARNEEEVLAAADADEGLAERDLKARSTYGTPLGGWGAIHYPPGTGMDSPHYPAPPGGWASIKYPAGTCTGLPHYAPPPGGWGTVHYPQGSGARFAQTIAPPVITKKPAKASATLKYAAPPGVWGSVHYPPDTGSNLQHYPQPPGGWGSVQYPPSTGANLIHYPAPPGGWGTVHYRAPLASRKNVKQVASQPQRYASLPGELANVAYSAGTKKRLPYPDGPSGSWNNIHYPHGTGANLPYYAAPPGGW